MYYKCLRGKRLSGCRNRTFILLLNSSEEVDHFWLRWHFVIPGKHKKVLQDQENASKSHVIHLFGRSNLIIQRTREDRKKKNTILYKESWAQIQHIIQCFSYFMDKTQAQYKWHVNLGVLKLMHKACQQQTHWIQGACLTQWDCKLELHRMQQFKGTQMTSAVLGNRELSSCSLFCTMIPFAIVLVSVVNDWEKQRDKRTGEQGWERQFVHKPQLPRTCLCFHPKQPQLSWESLTDSSLHASLLCDSYHTTEASVLCSSSPSYSEEWKYIFSRCIQTWVPHTSGGAMKVITMKYKIGKTI